jgi:molybdenum cofactor guanylyltransferase
MQTKKTALILAGGKSQRFYPLDKCFITLNNKPLIQHAIDRISRVTEEIIVAARDEEQGWRIKKIIENSNKIVFAFDSSEGVGPLAGFLSGLERASFSYSIVIGCDMPFVDPAVAKFLFEIASSAGYDAAVPKWENGMLEPLHAVYQNAPMRAAIKGGVRKGAGKISDILLQLKNVYFLPVARIREIDPGLKTFTNINTTEALWEISNRALHKL